MQRSQGLFLLTLATGCFALGLSEKRVESTPGREDMFLEVNASKASDLCARAH